MENSIRKIAIDWWSSLPKNVQQDYFNNWQNQLPISNIHKSWDVSFIATGSTMEMLYKYFHPSDII